MEGRVVFLVLDGLPARHLSPHLTPHLWALAGGSPGRATGVMPADTYPNHATFVTGVGPDEHGIVANWLYRDGALRPAWEVGLRAPTLFDRCERPTALVVGDQHLVGVMGGAAADHHWPPGGDLPEGAATDRMGYADDPVTMQALVKALAEPDFALVVGHLNTPDTAGHLDGPDSAEALDCYRAVDARVGVLRDEALAARWDDTVLVVVSDHTMEPVQPDPFDLGPAARERGLEWMPEGGSALVKGDDPEGGAWLDSLDAVAGHRTLHDDVRLAWAHPGHWFGVDGYGGFKGMHGNPATLEQVAVVAGGHPAAAALAAEVAHGNWQAADWAPALAALL